MAEELTKVEAIEKSLKTSIETAREFLAPMQKNAELCVTLLSKFSKPFTAQKEYDEAVENMSKVRPVMEKVEQRRKEITGGLDELKQVMMTPEKAIKAAYEVTKSFCDAWNQKLANDAKIQKAAIEKTRQAEIEAIDIKTSLVSKIEMFIANKVAGVDGVMLDFFSKITLETFDASAKAVNSSPALKQIDYEAFFSFVPKPVHCTAAKVDEIVAAVKTEYSFKKVSEMYAAEMVKQMIPWREKLPEKKIELEQLAQKSAKDKVKAAKEAAEKLEADKLAAKKAEEQAIAAKESAINTAANSEKVNAEFVSQVKTQGIDQPTGVRTAKHAKFSCEEKDMPVVLSELIFTCVTNPKHPGIYDKDKKGITKTDADGNPLYADWLESMLKFYAANCKPTIAGLEVYEKVSTTIKK